MVIKTYRSHWPAPLIAIVITTILVWGTSAQQYGIATIGDGFQPGLPVVNWGAFQPGPMRELVIPALNLALVSFVSLMLTARSFAAKMAMKLMLMQSSGHWVLRTLCLGYLRDLPSVEPIPGPRLMIPLGKSQLVSIVAALLIGLVVAFFTQPLQFIPVSALGIVLMYASWSLMIYVGYGT